VSRRLAALERKWLSNVQDGLKMLPSTLFQQYTLPTLNHLAIKQKLTWLAVLKNSRTFKLILGKIPPAVSKVTGSKKDRSLPTYFINLEQE
jgi:hypothetical protein